MGESVAPAYVPRFVVSLLLHHYVGAPLRGAFEDLRSFHFGESGRWEPRRNQGVMFATPGLWEGRLAAVTSHSSVTSAPSWARRRSRRRSGRRERGSSPAAPGTYVMRWVLTQLRWLTGRPVAQGSSVSHLPSGLAARLRSRPVALLRDLQRGRRARSRISLRNPSWFQLLFGRFDVEQELVARLRGLSSQQLQRILSFVVGSYSLGDVRSPLFAGLHPSQVERLLAVRFGRKRRSALFPYRNMHFSTVVDGFYDQAYILGHLRPY